MVDWFFIEPFLSIFLAFLVYVFFDIIGVMRCDAVSFWLSCFNIMLLLSSCWVRIRCSSKSFTFVICNLVTSILFGHLKHCISHFTVYSSYFEDGFVVVRIEDVIITSVMFSFYRRRENYWYSLYSDCEICFLSCGFQ